MLVQEAATGRRVSSAWVDPAIADLQAQGGFLPPPPSPRLPAPTFSANPRWGQTPNPKA